MVISSGALYHDLAGFNGLRYWLAELWQSNEPLPNKFI
jgi:hypothetical protein